MDIGMLRLMIKGSVKFTVLFNKQEQDKSSDAE